METDLSDADFSKTLDLMAKYGGSFVASLADCARKADPKNRRRLAQAFPEIFEKYGPAGIFWDNEIPF